MKYNWRKVRDGVWWAPDHGSAYRLKDGWYAMNSSDPKVPIEPVVGPFSRAREAITVYDTAMEKRHG